MSVSLRNKIYLTIKSDKVPQERTWSLKKKSETILGCNENKTIKVELIIHRIIDS